VKSLLNDEKVDHEEMMSNNPRVVIGRGAARIIIKLDDDGIEIFA
jgi:hypothetical protein